MSLQLIIGGSGTGKSEYLYNMVLEEAAAHPDRRFLVLVPEQYNMQTNKHLIRLHPDHAFMNIDILSFERLAWRVFDELGIQAQEILQDTGKSMIIRRLLAEHRDELLTFAGNVRQQGFALQMRSMISEFIQYGVTPEYMMAQSALLGQDEALFAKMKDMHVIYSAFMKFIEERYMTAEELLGRLNRVIGRSQFLRESYVFMDGYTGFTPVQYGILVQLLKLSPRAVMTMSADASGDIYEKPDPENLFYITRDTLFRLDKLCSEEDIPRETDILLLNRHRYGDHQDLAALEGGIFRTPPAVYDGSCDHVEAHRLHDPDAEMRFIAMRIHELVHDYGMRYADIAIVSSDLQRYARRADYWFDKYQIPCFIDRRRPVGDNMLAEWIRSLLGLFRNGFSYDSVFRYLKNGLSGFAPEETDLLENYALALGIRGQKRWSVPFTALMDGMDEDGLATVNSLRGRLIDDLAVVTPVLNRSKNQASDMAAAILGMMDRLDIKGKVSDWQQLFEARGDLDRAAEYGQIYDVVAELLREIGRTLGDEQMTTRDLTDVFEAGLTEVKIGMIPPAIDQVLFGDLRRTRLDNIKVLFFAGMNDGLIPLPAQTGGLITEQERETLARLKLQLAPSARENFSTDRFYIYAALSKPSQQLIITFSSFDSDGSACQPASLMRQIMQILPRLTIGRGTPRDRSVPFTDIHQAWRYLLDGLRKLAEGEQADDDWFSVYRWFSTHAGDAVKVEKLTDAAFYAYAGGMLSPEAVERLYHGRLGGGVTMLEQYASCAYSHFLIYGLKLKQRQIYKLMAPDIGTILHDALSRFSGAVTEGGHNWHDIPDRLRDELADRSIRQAADQYHYALLKDTARSSYMIERLSGLMKRTVWALQTQIKKGDMEPFGSEIRFTTEVVSDALLAAGGDGRLVMHGRIDRTDRYEDDSKIALRVIDYKSGENKLDPTKVYYGIQLQLLVYMNAVCDQTRAGQGTRTVVPAGVFYYHIDDPMIETKISDELMNAGQIPEGDLLKELKMEGLAVGDEMDDSLIRIMDNRPEDPPAIMPVAYNKDSISVKRSSIISTDDFAWLSVFVKERQKRLADRIFKGDIAVDPYIYGKDSPCTYCGFRAVCRFEPGSRGYGYRRLKKVAKDEGFRRLAKEAEHGI